MQYIKQCFELNNPSSKLVARYITLCLWVIGSLYIMNMEYAKPVRDWLTITTTPITWVIVIALPVIGYNAWKENRKFSSVFIFVCAIVGSIYTLTSNISRQSNIHDSAISNASFAETDKIRLRVLVEKDEKMLKEALGKQTKECDNKQICEAIKRTIEVYQSSLKNHQNELNNLGIIQLPSAGEERIVNLIALFGYDRKDMSAVIYNIMPLFLGLFLEITAMASAIYGFHEMYLVTEMTIPNTDIQKKFERIQFFEHQLKLPLTTNIDKRTLEKNLELAKRELVETISKKVI
jgi:hypothetical protein